MRILFLRDWHIWQKKYWKRERYFFVSFSHKTGVGWTVMKIDHFPSWPCFQEMYKKVNDLDGNVVPLQIFEFESKDDYESFMRKPEGENDE